MHRKTMYNLINYGSLLDLFILFKKRRLFYIFRSPRSVTYKFNFTSDNVICYKISPKK